MIHAISCLRDDDTFHKYEITHFLIENIINLVNFKFLELWV